MRLVDSGTTFRRGLRHNDMQIKIDPAAAPYQPKTITITTENEADEAALYVLFASAKVDQAIRATFPKCKFAYSVDLPHEQDDVNNFTRNLVFVLEK